MLWMKLLGITLILSAGGIAAATAANLEKRRLIVLEAWIDLIFFIQSQIDCYLTPLDEILALADPQLYRDCTYEGCPPTLHDLLIASEPYLTREGPYP